MACCTEAITVAADLEHALLFFVRKGLVRQVRIGHPERAVVLERIGDFRPASGPQPKFPRAANNGHGDKRERNLSNNAAHCAGLTSMDTLSMTEPDLCHVLS